MVSDPSGPPGLTRSKTSHSQPSSVSRSPHIFSPTPSLPRNNWFQLLASPTPSTPPLAPPAVAVTSNLADPQPHASLVCTTGLDTCYTPRAPIVNNVNITNLATLGPTASLSSNDPWTCAHARVCAHALEDCAACSIAIVCCSCRALRFTPGPPPASPSGPLSGLVPPHPPFFVTSAMLPPLNIVIGMTHLTTTLILVLWLNVTLVTTSLALAALTNRRLGPSRLNISMKVPKTSMTGFSALAQLATAAARNPS